MSVFSGRNSGGRWLEDAPVQVFSITRWQRFAWEKPKCSLPVRESFGAKKQKSVLPGGIKFVRQIEHMSHIRDFDLRFE